MTKPAPFLWEKPKAQKAPKTYKRYRALLSNAEIGPTELHRSRAEAINEIVAALLDSGALVVTEVVVVAKRETRYEEVNI